MLFYFQVNLPQTAISKSIVGVEFESAFKVSNGLLVLFEISTRPTMLDVTPCQFWVQFNEAVKVSLRLMMLFECPINDAPTIVGSTFIGVECESTIKVSLRLLVLRER